VSAVDQTTSGTWSAVAVAPLGWVQILCDTSCGWPFFKWEGVKESHPMAVTPLPLYIPAGPVRCMSLVQL
jgi:hypothetical protein